MAKVLVAEDDIVSRTLISKAVEALGHTTIKVSNGKTAWSILTDNPDIELLITDIMMPDLDGKELIKIIRGNDETANLPVIIISGVVSYNEIRAVLELGASRFMPKPIDIRELKRYVETLLKKRVSESAH